MKLRSDSPFFQPGPPAEPGRPDPEVVAFLASHAEGEILDLGGGRGAYALALAAMGRRVTVAEVDPACLESLRQSGLPAIDMNAVSWADLEGRFDTVMLVEVLEHVEDYREFFRRALACSRKKALLTVPTLDDFPKLFAAGLTYNHVAVSDHLHQFTTLDIAAMLEGEGCSHSLTPASHLFPDALLGLLYREMWGGWKGRLALSSVRFFQKRGWLPRLFPARVFAEAFKPALASYLKARI